MQQIINILTELEKYHKNVAKHYCDFLETKRIWAKIMEHFAYAFSVNKAENKAYFRFVKLQ